MIMIAGYKGFQPGLICRDKRYKEHTVFIEGDAIPCKKGMHFCVNPIDVLHYYPLVRFDGRFNEYMRVESTDNLTVIAGDKCCSQQLRTGHKLSALAFIKTCRDFMARHAKNKKFKKLFICNKEPLRAVVGERTCSVVSNYAPYGIAVGTSTYSIIDNRGIYGAAVSTGANAASISTGACSVSANTAEYSMAVVQSVKSCAVAIGRRSHACATNNRDVAIVLGDYGNADVSMAAESLAVSFGNCGRVKGALGCWLVCAEYRVSEVDFRPHIVDVKLVQVDGEVIKADTWYELENGEFVEAIDTTD